MNTRQCLSRQKRYDLFVLCSFEEMQCLEQRHFQPILFTHICYFREKNLKRTMAVINIIPKHCLFTNNVIHILVAYWILWKEMQFHTFDIQPRTFCDTSFCLLLLVQEHMVQFIISRMYMHTHTLSKISLFSNFLRFSKVCVYIALSKHNGLNFL